MQKKEIELAGVGDKLASLARRITDLPAGVPAEAFYDEMKRLAENQAKLKDQIEAAKKRGEAQRIASNAEYDRLLGKLRERLDDVSPESKRRIIQTLVKKVVVTRTGFELHYFAGVEQLKQGEVLASPSFSLDKKISVQSSFKQLNGGLPETRTRTPVKAMDFESIVSTIPPGGHDLRRFVFLPETYAEGNPVFLVFDHSEDIDHALGEASLVGVVQTGLKTCQRDHIAIVKSGFGKDLVVRIKLDTPASLCRLGRRIMAKLRSGLFHVRKDFFIQSQVQGRGFGDLVGFRGDFDLSLAVHSRSGRGGGRDMGNARRDARLLQLKGFR